MNEEMMMDPMEVRKTSSTTIERNKAAEGLTIREGAAKEDEKLAEAGGGYGNAGWAAEKVVRSICSPQGRRWERVPRTESEIKRQGWQSEGYFGKIQSQLGLLQCLIKSCRDGKRRRCHGRISRLDPEKKHRREGSIVCLGFANCAATGDRRRSFFWIAWIFSICENPLSFSFIHFKKQLRGIS
ncbi:hypothetical protein AAC387_Pa10g1129 [Persea americana]